MTKAVGGGGDGVAARARTAIEGMLATVAAEDRKGLAPHIAYRGGDAARKWKDGSNYDAKDEKSRVDQMFSQIQFLAMKGKPSFDEFATEKESEGTWLLWHMTFGEKKAVFACLEAGGKILLGDID